MNFYLVALLWFGAPLGTSMFYLTENVNFICHHHLNWCSKSLHYSSIHFCVQACKCLFHFNLIFANDLIFWVELLDLIDLHFTSSLFLPLLVLVFFVSEALNIFPIFYCMEGDVYSWRTPLRNVVLSEVVC